RVHGRGRIFRPGPGYPMDQPGNAQRVYRQFFVLNCVTQQYAQQPPSGGCFILPPWRLAIYNSTLRGFPGFLSQRRKTIMSKWLAGLVVVLLFASVALAADDYRVEAAKEAAPAGLSADVSAQLAPGSYKVLGPGGKVLCDIWLAKQWTTKADFQPS